MVATLCLKGFVCRPRSPDKNLGETVARRRVCAKIMAPAGLGNFTHTNLPGIFVQDLVRHPVAAPKTLRAGGGGTKDMLLSCAGSGADEAALVPPAAGSVSFCDRTHLGLSPQTKARNTKSLPFSRRSGAVLDKLSLAQQVFSTRPGQSQLPPPPHLGANVRRRPTTCQRLGAMESGPGGRRVDEDRVQTGVAL